MTVRKTCLQGFRAGMNEYRAKPVSEPERSGGERALRGSGYQKEKPVSEPERSGGERALRGKGYANANERKTSGLY